MGLPPGEEAPGAAEPARPPDGAPPQPGTGDARVDDALSRLDDVSGLPVAEHVTVFEQVHQLLMDALADADSPGGDLRGGGEQHHRPGGPGH
jgi:hypothetical protein